MKIVKKIPGVQGFKNIKEAKSTAQHAKEKMEEYQIRMMRKETEANAELGILGKRKLEIVQDTIVPFMQYLESIKQKTRGSEYKALSNISISQEEYVEMQKIGVTAGSILSGAVQVGSIGALAITGVPAAVTSIVTAVGTASTGTAISSLSGAAATNATLAFLGGGSLAAGGGGMAAGAALLSSITIGVTGGVTLIATALYINYLGKKSLRKAEDYALEVDQACVAVEASLDFLDRLTKCVNEQINVLSDLKQRIQERFFYFRPLLSDFCREDLYQVEVFQTCGLLCKAVSEIAKTPVLEKDGSISNDFIVTIREAKALIET